MKRVKRNVPEFQPPNPKIVESANKSCNEISETYIKSIKIISPTFFEKMNNYYIYEINFPIDSELKQIKYNSFSNLNLYSITFPPSLWIIFPEAFNKCYNLEQINFTKNHTNQSFLKFIGDNGLTNTKVKSIVIPDSIKEIGSFCFPKSLSSIEFENGAPNLKEIGDNAFSNTQIETIKIPSNISPFLDSKNIFYKCKNLRTIIFDSFPVGSSIRHASEMNQKSGEKKFKESFQKVDDLNKISQDEAKSLLLSQTKVQKIEIAYSNLNYFYFFNTPNLVSIEIPKSDKVQYIKTGGCVYTKDKKALIISERNINEALICSNCQFISNYALNVKSLRKVSFEEKSELHEISFLSFYDSQIKDITLPNGIELMQYGAFYKCKKLESVNIPKSLDLIDLFTFSYTNLTMIVIPKNIVKIGFGSFLCCFNLMSVSFEKQSELVEIDDYAFSCTKIESILIPKSVIRIGNFCFSNCHQLKSIKFEENSKINKIGSNCFKNTQINETEINQIFTKIDFSFTKKSSNKKEKIFFVRPNLVEIITQVSIPSKVEKIGFHAFFDCPNLVKVEIVDFSSSKLKEIHEGAFYNCTSLTEFKIPETVIFFGQYSFKNCVKYDANINIKECKNVFVCKKAFESSGINSFYSKSENLKVFNSAFLNCSKLNTFSAEVTYNCKFGKFAFMNCSSLKSFNLSKNVQKIKFYESCFENSSIEKVVIPEKLIKIPKSCFKFCRNLKEVLITDETILKFFGDEAFYESGIEKIFIPKRTRIIGKHCFEKCRSLIELNFSEKLGYCILKESSFSMSGIETLTIPKSIINIDIGCFENCKNLKTVHFPVHPLFEVIKENVFRSSGIEFLTIGLKIKYIDKCAFADCKNLKGIILLGRSKIEMCVSSFNGCNIESVYYLSRIQIYNNIDDDHFINFRNHPIYHDFIKTLITNEKTILIDQVFHYKYYAIFNTHFNNNLNFKQLKLGLCINSSKIKENRIDIVKYINGAYYTINNSILLFCDFSINSLTVPKETKIIQSLRFSNLEKIDFEDGIQLIKICMFSFEGLLIEEISIPDSVTLIDNYAFANCIKLKKVNISKNSNLKLIGIGAFQRTAIETILFPSKLLVVGDYAFLKCNQLKTIKNYSNDINFGLKSFYQSSIEQINFPPICYFSESSFKECYKLKQLNFLKNPERIVFDMESFSFSGIEYIKLDCNLDIGENAFTFCPNLKQVICKGNNIKCCSNSFDFTSIDVFVANIQIEVNYKHFDQQNYLEYLKNQIVLSKIKKLSLGLSIINKKDSSNYNHRFYISNNYYVADDELYFAELIDNFDLYIKDTSDANKQIKKNEILRVPNNVKKLNFQAMPHLKKILWPQSCVVEDLGDPYFFSYYNLIEITIPKLVRKISPHLFEHCHFLKNVSFEEGSILSEIGEFAFSNTKVERVDIPSSVKIIKQSAFAFTTDLKLVSFSGEIIEKEAFYESGITEFNLSNNTRIIESNSFQYCHNLTTFFIDINNSNLEEINEYSFAETSINEINIPSKIKSIKSFAFSGCKYLKEVRISSNSKLKEIDDYSFSCNLSLEKINVPNTIQKISHLAFINTPNLVSILAESNRYYKVMKNNVVYSSKHELIFAPRNLCRLDINAHCSAISSSAFCGSILEEVSFLGNSVTRIEKMAFAHSIKLNIITIPDSVKIIEDEAFINCQNLKTVEFKQNCQLKEIPKFCFAFSGLKTIKLPVSIQIINDSSFYFCLNLNSIDLYNTNVKYIGDSAFSNTNIEEIRFPPSIQYIENHSFENTKSLKLIDFGHCYKIKNWNKYDKMKKGVKNFVKMNKKIKSYSKQSLKENQNLNLQFSKTLISNPVVISKPASPVIIRPIPSQTLTRKTTPFNLNKYSVRPPRSPNNFHSPRQVIKESKTSDIFQERKTSSNLAVKCFIHESSFCNSSVRIFMFNHNEYKWFDFFDKCNQIEKYFVNSNLCISLKRIRKENSNNNFLGSFYKVVKLFMKNEELIPYKREFPDKTKLLLSPFHFLNSSKLTKITLTDDLNIKVIPKCTFSFTNLKEITIPSTVVRIKISAFKYCHILEKVTFLPNSKLKSIESFAFYECYNLATISIPNGVEFIPLKCFSFSGLTSIELCDSIKRIEQMAFFNCTKLSEIVLNEGLVEICEFAFANNYSLSLINLPDSLEIIKKYAFADCFNLKMVNTNENTKITEIHIGSFENTQIESLKLNPGIKILSISKGMTKLNQITFYKSDLLHFKQSNNGLIYECVDDLYYEYNKEFLKNIILKAVLINDSNLNYGKHLLIASSIFLQRQPEVYKLIFIPKNSTSINITENCIFFGSFVFDEMKNLDTIEFSGNCSLDKENNSIFSNVRNVKIQSEKLYIENDFFRNFESLESVDFDVSKDFFVIPKSCFYGKAKLTKIVIPRSVEMIGKKAFKNCISLETVEMNSVSRLLIEDEAFYNCSSLLNIKIPNLVLQIGKKAFMNCIKLKEFEIDDKNNQDERSIKCIDDYVFKNCSSLVSFRVPDLCKSIGRYSFMNCTKLTTVKYEGYSLNHIYAGAFCNCSSLQYFNVSLNRNFVREIFIDEDSFMNCVSLKEILFNSFKNEMPKVKAQSHRQVVSYRSFYNCKSLKKVRFFVGSLKEIHEDAFTNCSSLELLEINSKYSMPYLPDNIHYRSFVNVSDSIVIKLFRRQKEVLSLNINDIKRISKKGIPICKEHSSHLNKSFLSFDANDNDEKIKFSKEPYLFQFIPNCVSNSSFSCFNTCFGSLKRKTIGEKNKIHIFDDVRDYQTEYQYLPESRPPLNI